METFEQRADEVSVIRERVFPVEGMNGMCKGPEAEQGERMIENEFGQAGKALPLFSFLLCQTRMKTAACPPLHPRAAER